MGFMRFGIACSAVLATVSLYSVHGFAMIGDFSATRDSVETGAPFGVGEGDGHSVIALFNWNDTEPLTELVSESSVSYVAGSSLGSTDPYDHFQLNARSLIGGADGQYANVPLNGTPVANSMDKLTVNAFVRRDTNGGTDYIAFRPNGFFMGTDSTGAVSFGVYTENRWVLATASGPNYLPIGQWHEIRGVYDGTNLYVYIDDILRVTAAQTGTVQSSTATYWNIGGYGSTNTLLGAVTDVWVSAAAEHPRPHRTPLARWDWQNSQGTTLTSANPMPDAPAEHGTISGATFVDGDPGRALSFQSGSYVDASGNVTHRAGGLTVAAWIRPTAPGNGSDQFIVTKPYSYNLRLLADGSVQCRARDSAGLWRTANTSGLWHLAAATWYHLACTFDGETLRVYIDGKMVNSVDGAPGFYGTTHGLIIGANTSHWQNFLGEITGVLLADRATEDFASLDRGYARYDWTDDTQTSLTSVVDHLGNATFGPRGSAPVWVQDSPADFRASSVDLGSGRTITIDGRALAGVQEFVLELWVKVQAAPSGTAVLATRTNDFDLRVTSGMRPIWEVHVPSVGGTGGLGTVLVDPGVDNVLEVGRWHHLAARWRYNGRDWVAQLQVDSIPYGSATISHARPRDTTSINDICIGSCGATQPAALVTAAELVRHTCATCDLVLEPGTEVTNCDTTQTLEIDVNALGSGSQPIIRYWYATDENGRRCRSNHPIVLLQGLGQHDESWSLCHIGPDGTNIGPDGEKITEQKHSLAKNLPDVCNGDDKFTNDITDWCPDVVGILVAKGAEVITVDYGQAQKDINSLTPVVGWDKDWLRSGGTQEQKGGAGEPFYQFDSYLANARRYKGAGPVVPEYGRFSHPLDNAYVASLLVDYFYRSDGYAVVDADYVPGRKLTLVGHSAGGVIANWATVARSWSTRADGNYYGKDAYDQVDRVVTLGSPHLGSRLIDWGSDLNNHNWTLGSTAGFASMFASDIFGDIVCKWLCKPNGDSLKTAIWHGMKVWAAIGSHYPITPELHPINWTPSDLGTYRGRIDSRIKWLKARGDIVPVHYQIAGLYNADKKNVSGSCERIPADEEIRKEFIKKEYGIEGYSRQIIETTVPASSDIYPGLATANADDVRCEKHDLTGIAQSEDCSTKEHWRYYCGGHQNIAIGWRLLTQKQGEIVPPQVPESELVGGRNFGDVISGLDDLGISFWLSNPGGYEFGSNPLSDGAVTLDEATGLDPDYSVIVRGVNSLVCDWAFEDGVPLNHHQLRTKEGFLHTFFCDPDGQPAPWCTGMKLSHFLLR